MWNTVHPLILLTIVSLPGAQTGEMTSPVGTFG
jgi:hypothetical protein